MSAIYAFDPLGDLIIKYYRGAFIHIDDFTNALIKNLNFVLLHLSILIIFILIIIAISKTKSMLFYLCIFLLLNIIIVCEIFINFPFILGGLFFLTFAGIDVVANVLFILKIRKKDYFYLKIFLMLGFCCLFTALSVMAGIGMVFFGFWFTLYSIAAIWIPTIGYIILCFWRRKKEKTADILLENTKF